MHSSAYIEFVERVEKDGYKQGYNEELFKLILPDEVNDVEKIVEEKFDNGDIHSIFARTSKMQRNKKIGRKGTTA